MYSSVIATGVLVAIAMWIAQRQLGVLPKLLAIAGITLIIILVELYHSTAPSALGPTSWYNQSPFREAILYACMLFGMAAYSLSSMIEKRRDRILEWSKSGKAGDKPGIEFDVWEFSYPFLFSVITFGAIVSQLTEPVVDTRSVIIAFQTGFFWQTIFDKVRSKVDKS